jgi:hypothetical protein
LSQFISCKFTIYFARGGRFSVETSGFTEKTSVFTVIYAQKPKFFRAYPIGCCHDCMGRTYKRNAVHSPIQCMHWATEGVDFANAMRCLYKIFPAASSCKFPRGANTV